MYKNIISGKTISKPMHFQLTKIGGNYTLITNITVQELLLLYWAVNHCTLTGSYVMVHVPDIIDIVCIKIRVSTTRINC
jgi:hypothetical protein